MPTWLKRLAVRPCGRPSLSQSEADVHFYALGAGGRPSLSKSEADIHFYALGSLHFLSTYIKREKIPRKSSEGKTPVSLLTERLSQTFR